jgi:hypothetical protein
MKPMQHGGVHTGEERYEVTLKYGPEEKREIDRLTRDGQIIVDTVHLVYTRKVGGAWERYVNGRHGSRAEGNVKIENGMGSVGQRRTKQIFTSTLGEVCAWTAHLPGLRLAIDDVESTLPR